MPPQPPPADLQFSQTNVSEIKSQIGKKLGPDRAEQYFGLLNGLLSQKRSKVEFDRLCFRLLGRENLPLHNHLIRTILRNACQGKVPPVVNKEKGVPKPTGIFVKTSPQIENILNSPQTVNPAPNIFSNGDILPPSPHGVRTGNQDWKVRDRPDTLGLDGKIDVHSRPSPSLEKVVHKENGVVSLYGLKRPRQHQEGVPVQNLVKRQRLDKALVSLEHKECTFHHFDLDSSGCPLRVPLGIPCFSASVGSGRRSLISSAFTSTSSDSFSGNYDSGELCHTELLKKRMEKVAEAHGLEGVTLDCANLLNNGLDLYLKQLIKSSVELAGTRLGRDLKQSVPKQKPYMKPVNGVWADNHTQTQNINRISEGPNELRSNFAITMQDFKIAMELKPQQLGEDWPLLLEKICVRSFEE